jgi:DNA repair protein RecN (Recombination protein N)
MADSHFRVDKQVIDPEGGKKRSKSKRNSEVTETNGYHADSEVRTVVRVALLNEQQRREELAQIAGGKSDQEAIAFADSLLAQAANARAASMATQVLPTKMAAKAKATSKSKAVHPR